MERIFTYIAALLSRILFSLHVGVTIWRLTVVTSNHNYWYIMAVFIFCLFLETLFTVVYRKGHEYYWLVTNKLTAREMFIDESLIFDNYSRLNKFTSGTVINILVLIKPEE